MLPTAELGEALQGIRGCPYTGVLTRYIDSDAFEAGGRNCFYDLGSPQDGKRYTPKGGARGLYLAEGVPAALGEATQRGLAALNPDRVATRQQLDVEVVLKSTLDLGDVAVRRRLKTTLDELKSPWRGGLLPPYAWPPTWLLGHAVFGSQRFDAIRYPSAKVARTYCLFIFTERLGPRATLTAKRPGQGLVTLKGSFLLAP